MIITQTPIRISFLGGGTDFRQFFSQEEGWVVSSAIDRYIFVIIKQRFDQKIRVGYTRTELVDSIDEIQHELVREALRKTGIRKGVEVNTMGDIPAAGSGMGSSSTVTVGLLNAMYHYLGEPKEPETLAREACEIEIDVLGKPIGIQDQYIAAYGGLRFMHFGRDGRVGVTSLSANEKLRQRLSRNLMLFFTNVERKAESVLEEQVKNLNGNLQILREMKKLALLAQSAIEAEEFDEFGLLLHRGWELKKQLASRVSNGSINAIYESARKAGALGGKITGAGGGGFLLLYCPLNRQEEVRDVLKEFQELPFKLERDGTKVIFNYRRF
jgi:D-glycero-alpha-D-manno-heptose-7-phosphate kinase